MVHLFATNDQIFHLVLDDQSFHFVELNLQTIPMDNALHLLWPSQDNIWQSDRPYHNCGNENCFDSFLNEMHYFHRCQITVSTLEAINSWLRLWLISSPNSQLPSQMVETHPVTRPTRTKLQFVYIVLHRWALNHLQLDHLFE